MASIYPNDIGGIHNRTGVLVAGMVAVGAGLYTGIALASPVPDVLARRRTEYAIVESSQLENVSGELPMTELAPAAPVDTTSQETRRGMELLVEAARSRIRAAQLLPVDPEGDARVEAYLAAREIGRSTRPLRRR